MHSPPALTVLITARPRRAPFERVDQPSWLTESMFLISTTTHEIVRECPACDGELVITAEIAPKVKLPPSQIERMGSADCERCGEAWVYCLVPEDADDDRSLVELNEFAELTQNLPLDALGDH